MNKAKVIKLLSLLALIALVIWAGLQFRDQINLNAIQQTIQGYGFWGPFVFILIYAAATVLFLPGSILTLAGGLIFGAWWGTLINLTGATIGATVAFLVSRYIASDWIAEKTGGRLKQLIKGVEEEGWKFVAVVRLVPLIPFNLLNYALGLTRVRVLAYVIATAIFMLPGAFAYTYVGSLGETFIHGGGIEIVRRVAIAIGLLVLLACIPWLVKRFRKQDAELLKQVGEDDNE